MFLILKRPFYRRINVLFNLSVAHEGRLERRQRFAEDLERSKVNMIYHLFLKQ